MRNAPFTPRLVLLLALGFPPEPVSAKPVAELPDAIDACEMPGYKRLSPVLAVGGAPSLAVLADLAARGVTTVIDLRPEAEGTAPEKAMVEAFGLRYVQIPVTPQTFQRKDAEAVGHVLTETTEGSVLLHCSSSNRVGGVLAVLEALKGRSLDEALVAGRNAGLKSAPMEDAVRRVLGAADPGNAPKP